MDEATGNAVMLAIVAGCVASGLAMWRWGRPGPSLAGDARTLRFHLFLVWGPLGFAGLFGADFLSRLLPAWFAREPTALVGVGWFLLCMLIWSETPSAVPRALVPTWYPAAPDDAPPAVPNGRPRGGGGTRSPGRRGSRPHRRP
jgi:hypothetical protein